MDNVINNITDIYIIPALKNTWNEKTANKIINMLKGDNTLIYRYNTIGECCREWRKDKNISIMDMAEYCNCTNQNISAFERGENISGRILMEYVRRGLSILAVVDDLYICKDNNGGIIL